MNYKEALEEINEYVKKLSTYFSLSGKEKELEKHIILDNGYVLSIYPFHKLYRGDVISYTLGKVVKDVPEDTNKEGLVGIEVNDSIVYIEDLSPSEVEALESIPFITDSVIKVDEYGGRNFNMKNDLDYSIFKSGQEPRTPVELVKFLASDETPKPEIHSFEELMEANQTLEITPQQIGQATRNTPTTAKNEAKEVENGENTREKEGEEVGDDN